MIIFLGIVCILLACIVIWQYSDGRKQAKRITALSDYLQKVQDNAELPKADEAYEGELSILQSEIYKAANMLQMEFASEKKKNELLNELLTDVSHQIKTPLAAITIMSDNLEKGTLSEKEKQICIRRIRQQTSHINTLVRSLLVSSEIDAGVFRLKKTEIPLAAAVNQALDPLRALAEIRQISLDIHVSDEIKIQADCAWLSEAFSNILKNCIEHTPEEGMISVSASAANLYADLVIEDNGEGMDEETLSQMFERFYKSGGSPDSNGIGLYLSRQIIQLHNGTVKAESVQDHGTKFYIRLFSADTF